MAKPQISVHYEHSDATLLSLQPNSLKEEANISDKEIRQWASLRGHLESRLIMLRQWRNSWWFQSWATLAEYILPRRSIWLTQSTGGQPTPNNMTRGRPLNSSIKDPTATFASRICAAGLMSGLASASREWFNVVPVTKGIELDSDGRKWIDTVKTITYNVLAGSNFYNSFAQECEDLVVFGTAPCIVYEDEKDIIRCYNPAIGEYYLASSATLRIDGLYRQFVMTVSQMVDFFGLENCPADVQKLWASKGNSLETERIIAHSIEPNFDIAGCPKIAGNFAWREVYWAYGSGSKQPLSKKGFVDQPFSGARWATQSNDAYGRCPGMDILPDNVQLQVMTVRLSEAIEKQVRPPLIADITLKNQPSSILPGQVTYVQNLSAGSGMRSIYEVNPDIKGLAALIEQIQQRIKVGMFNDLFLMLETMPSGKMTAYEVAQKLQEKLQVLGPVIENIITESLKPKLKRIFGIMQRKGLIPPKPESMKNISIDIEFISILSLAQRASSTGGLERIAQLIGNMVAVYPEAKNILDPDQFIRTFNDLLANPEKILRSPEEVGKLLQQQQQQAQQAQHQADIAHGVQVANVATDAAANLANTQIGGGQTALSQLLGGYQ